MFLGDSALHGALKADAETLLRDVEHWTESPGQVETSGSDLAAGTEQVIAE